MSGHSDKKGSNLFCYRHGGEVIIFPALNAQAPSERSGGFHSKDTPVKYVLSLSHAVHQWQRPGLPGAIPAPELPPPAFRIAPPGPEREATATAAPHRGETALLGHHCPAQGCHLVNAWLFSCPTDSIFFPNHANDLLCTPCCSNKGTPAGWGAVS